MELQKPKTLDELKKNHKGIKSIYAERKKKLSPLDKLAVWITDKVGSMGFFAIIFAWTIIWLTWNTLAPKELRFDAYPAFALWLFISNLLQILLMPLIMVGQNLQGRHAESRAEADFEVNIKAEIEIETILQHLENQNTLMLEILRRLDARQAK